MIVQSNVEEYPQKGEVLSSNTDFMKYGDIIILIFDPNSQMKQDSNALFSGLDAADKKFKIGGLSATGFADCSVWVQSIPCEEDNFAAFKKALPDKGLQNTRDFLFQVTPKLKYDAHYEFDKMKKRLKEANDYSKKHMKKEIRGNPATSLIEDKLERLAKRVKVEKERNKELLVSKRGQIVTYGTDVHLQHIDSKLFLSRSSENAKTKKIGYCIKLTSWYSKNMTVKLFPKYKSRRTGEPIQYDDEIVVQGYVKDFYMDFAFDIPHDLNDYKFKKVESVFRKPINCSDKRGLRYRSIFAGLNKTSWNIIKFKDLNEIQNLSHVLSGFDMIRINHTELSGKLASAICYQTRTPEVYVRVYENENFPIEQNDIGSIWEIEKTSSFSGSIISIHKKQNENTNDATLYTEDIRLRHFLSGGLLSITPYKNDLLTLLNQDHEDIVPKNYVKIRLEPLLKNTQYAEKNRAYMIGYDKYYLKFANQIPSQKRNKHLVAWRNTKDKGGNVTFSPLMDKQLDETRRLTVFSTDVTTENAFKIKKVSESDKKDILYIRSFIPFLDFIISSFIHKDEEKLNNQRLEILKGLMVKMMGYLFDQTFDEFTDWDEIADEPLANRQRNLKDMGIIDLMTDVLSQPFISGIYDIKALKQSQVITKVLTVTYQTVKYAIKEYRPNELYCSQWLDLFLLQSLDTNNDNDIKAEVTLTELIDNNRRILEERIPKETINKFILLVSGEKDAKYLKILLAIIMCDGKPMVKTQHEISRLLLNDPKTKKKLLFQLRLQGNLDATHDNIEVNFIGNAVKDQWISLSYLKQISLLEKSSTYNFFVTLSRLLGILCAGRNYLAIKPLQEKYPYEVCFEILKSSRYDSEIREVFCNFIMTVWVDVLPMAKISMPNFIKIWSDLIAGEISENSASLSENFKPLKKLIFDYFAIKRNDETKILSTLPNCSLTFWMVKLLKLMLKLGLIGAQEIVCTVPPKNGEISRVQTQFDNLLFQIIYQLTGPDAQRVGQSKKQLLVDTAVLVCSTLNFQLKFEVNTKSQVILIDIKKQYDGLSENDRNEMCSAFENKTHKVLQPILSIAEKKVNKRQKYIESCDKFFDRTIKENYYWKFSSDQSMLYLLMSLTMLGDNRLTRWSIQLLNQIHSQSIKLKETFLGMQLIDDEYEEEYNKIIKFARQLQELSETSEFWYVEKGEVGKQEQQQIKFILKELFRFLEQSTNPSNEKKRNVIEEPEGEESIPGTKNASIDNNNVDFITLDGIKKVDYKPSRFHQNLYRNAGILKSLVNLLKYDLQVIDDNKMDKTKALDLVGNIYLILSWSCLDNEKNQEFFMKYIKDPFLKHFESQRMAGSPLFIGNFVKRNKKLHLIDKVFHMFVNSILKECDNTSRKDILKPYILNSILDLLQAADFRLKNNQNYVISKLFETSTYKDLSVTLNVKELKNWSDELNNAIPIDVNGKKIVVLNSEMCYNMVYIDLLKACAAGKNSFTENICQNYLPLKDLKSILAIEDLHEFIFIRVMTYFVEVFLEVEKENQFHIQEIVVNILPILIEKFETIFTKYMTCLKDTDKEKLYFGGYETSNTKQNYLKRSFQSVIAFYDCQIRVDINFSKHSQGAMIFGKFVESTLHMINSELKNITENEVFSKLKALKSNLIYSQDIPGSSKNDTSKRSILDDATEPKAMIHNALNMFNKRGSVLNHQQKPEQDDEIIDNITKLTKCITKDYFKSDLFSQRCNSEFFDMVDYVTDIGNKEPLVKKISFTGYCTALISYLMPTDDMNVYNVYDTIMSLKLFKMYIEGANKSVETGKCISEWEDDEWEDYFDEVTERQNQLIDLNITKLIAEIIVKENDQDIFEESINLSIGQLLGGNSKAQEEFYTHIAMSKNKMDLLAKIKESMDVNFESVKECFEQRTETITKGSDVKELDSYIANDKRIQDSLRYLRKIYRFLQLLCEGHNSNFQNFLRHQYRRTERLFSKNIDFVLYTASQFGVFVKYLNPHATDLGNKLVEFLVESVQGPCRGNQKQLFDGKIVDYTKDLMLEFGSEKDYIIKGFNNEKKKELYSIIKKSIKLLLALLEANDSKDLLTALVNSMDYDTLIKILRDELLSYLLDKNMDRKLFEQISQEQIESYVTEDVFDSIMTDAFDVFFLISKLKEYDLNYFPNTENVDPLDRKVYSFFKLHSGTIEVVFEESLTKLPFIIQPACRYIDDDVKTKFIKNLKRDTPKDKICDILKKSPEIFDLIGHFNSIFGKRQWLPQRTMNYLRSTIFAIALIINLLIFIFFEKKLYYGKAVNNPDFDSNHISFKVLGSIHSFVSGCTLIFYIIFKTPIMIQEGWRSHFEDYNLKLINNTNKTEEMPKIDLTFRKKAILEYSFREKNELLKKIHDQLGEYEYFTVMEILIFNSYFVLKDRGMLYLGIILFLSVGAQILDEPFYYSLQLLELIQQHEMLQNVIKAVTQNVNQVLYATFFGLLVINIYVFFAFNYMQADFWMGNVGPSGEGTCSTMVHCFLTVFSLGPRSSGSIGDVMTDISYSEDTIAHYYVRWATDSLIFYVLNIIIMNLIFGVIISTFAELRDKKAEIDTDIKEVCTICSQDRNTFEKNSKGFEYHLNVEHNPFNYIFYMYSLKRKFETEYSGMESYVDEEIKHESVAWIPQARALSILDGEELDINDTEEGAIPSAVVDQLNAVFNSLKDIDSKLHVNSNTD